MSTYSERLVLAMAVKGWKQTALAEAVGIKPQAIQYLCSRGKGSRHNGKIALKCGVNPEWLSDDEGPMLLGDNAAPIEVAQDIVGERSTHYHSTPLNEVTNKHSKQEDITPNFSVLMTVASPRTQEIIQQLQAASDDGRLTEEDLALLDSIIRRLMDD